MPDESAVEGGGDVDACGEGGDEVGGADAEGGVVEAETWPSASVWRVDGRDVALREEYVSFG